MTGSVTIHDHEVVSSRQRTAEEAFQLLMVQKGVPHDESSVEFKFRPDLIYRAFRFTKEQSTVIEWKPRTSPTPHVHV